MADDKKKSKINLKDRLGKSTMSGPSAAGGVPVPLPIPGGSAAGTPVPTEGGGAPAPAPAAVPRPPQGIAPPPGLSPGIPVPPFAQPKQAAAPKPTAVQQTIKVEESEVIHQERKKAQKKIVMFAAAAAVLGIGIGFFIGGAKQRSDDGQKVVKIAGELEKEIKASNDKLRELNDKLGEAGDGLKNKAYPDAVVTALGGLAIPFSAESLGLKAGGVAIPSKLARPLVSYAAKVEDVNKSKDSLKNLMGYAKAALEKHWKNEKEPVVSYSVIFGPEGSKGMMAELVPNKEPFPIGKDFPDSFTILRPERTQQGVKMAEKKASRWTKGDLTGSDPVAIPVQPASMAAFTGEELVGKLGAELRNLRKTIEGNKEDPQDTGGLLKEGEVLADDLRKTSLAR